MRKKGVWGNKQTEEEIKKSQPWNLPVSFTRVAWSRKTSLDTTQQCWEKRIMTQILTWVLMFWPDYHLNRGTQVISSHGDSLIWPLTHWVSNSCNSNQRVCVHTSLLCCSCCTKKNSFGDLESATKSLEAMVVSFSHSFLPARRTGGGGEEGVCLWQSFALSAGYAQNTQ